ncbi:YdcF family protein [Staphylococcus massiliensis CCUG 55927]|nr:YdcF family protein [Staphylococcus massiliensis CCUG 55927]
MRGCMAIFQIACTIIMLVLMVTLMFQSHRFMNNHTYISTIILGMCVICTYAFTLNIPLLIAVVTAVAFLGSLLKSPTVIKSEHGRVMIFRIIMRYSMYLSFIIGCQMLVHLNIFIISPLLNWLSYIVISALFAFSIYTLWVTFYLYQPLKCRVKAVLILGAGIYTETIPPLLKSRLDRALQIYQNQNPKPKLIVSGGQGPDEPIAEALAMKRYLMNQGVPVEAIITEAESTNTYTNMKFSKPYLDPYIHDHQHILCVTSHFHIARALRLAEKQRIPLIGIGSQTPYHFLDYAMIRDFLGLMYQYRLLLTVYFATLFILSFIKHLLF